MTKILPIVIVLALATGGFAFVATRSSGPKPLSEEVTAKIELARKFANENDFSRALTAIEEVEKAGLTNNEDLDFVRIQALAGQSRHSDASAAADAFLKSYPNSTRTTDVEVIRLTSEIASTGLGNPALVTSVNEFLNRNPNHSGASKLTVALAKQELAMGDDVAAQRRLERMIAGGDVRDPELFGLANALGKTKLNRLMAGGSEGETIYTVASGDSINRIANRHKVTEELLMQVNRITDPRRLQVGQKLRIPNVDWSLHADISTNTLVLKNHGEFFKLYRMRSGRESGTTPTGEFRVINKKRAPTWRPGNGHTYQPGDPNNELGTRWMAFEGDILGIHGTLHPDTIGHYASNGCIGLLTEDVEELFDLITVGTPLIIKGEQNLERFRVIPAPQVPPPQQVASR